MTTRNSTFSIHTSLRRFILAGSIAALLAMPTPRASAVDYYWDSDDVTAGFGSATGTWGTSAFWSTSSAGTGTTANHDYHGGHGQFRHRDFEL
jgi:hypothetical protein